MNSNGLLISIAWRIFKRDWKRKDLLVLLLSMAVAMASISVIYLVIDRIESATEREVADVLGADVVIASPREVPVKWLERADNLGLKSAQSVEFSSVLFAKEKLQLASIKAVSDGYPLKGRIEIAEKPYAESRILNTSPARGKLWLEPRLFSILSVQKADQVEVGYTELEVDGAIMLQPGQGSTLFNIAPTAIINIDDLAATKIIQPGSRVSYRYFFSGDDEALKAFTEQIKPELETSQRLLTVFDESPVAGSAITRSKKYIALSSLLTLILLGVAIAMSASRYARRQFDMSALMRCFGLTNNDVLKVFLGILTIVCACGVALGSAFGIVFQEFLVSILKQWITVDLPQADYSVLFIPLMATVILLLGFSVPSLIQVKNVPPMRVLRKQLEPMSVGSLSVYLLSAITLVIIMWIQMQDVKLLMSVLLGLVGVAVLFASLASLLLLVMKQFSNSRSAAVNFSLRQLDANKGITLLHLLAFSITIFVIALMVLVRTELLGKWQQSLGENIPNHFMVNVKPGEVEQIRMFFEQNHLQIAELYPMVRGRITGINDQDIKEAVSEEGQKHNSLRRELNITWSQQLPVGNQLVTGKWGWPESSDEPLISIEERTAQAIGLKVGDRINFSIGAEKWTAKIINVRSIDWQTFTPNFYVIANPGSMDGFNATYISSFRMEQENKGLLAKLVKQYPSITIIELDRIFEEVQSIIEKVSTAVEIIMIFVVIAGLALLWAAMEQTFDNKYKQSAILRTLGASKSFIAASFRFEYIWLALLSSTMAIAAVELVTYLIYRYAFEIEFQFHWQLWGILPAATLFLMLLASWQGVKRVTEPPPLNLIRQG
ncbi:ABC transporter permease [Aliikangiella sp. G2MR2-5]|uniref:ABC transporter permease n=1 Tax=Aliikangiella sp. G2MR2-5 TaxID=2788943 RepID=UPI0018AC3A31|nr:FtsX-like permease family protein [Aliikangiella sp. G2MR2-5]